MEQCMKFSFLPEEIKSEIDANLIDNEPLALARSNMAADGHMGESFIVAYEERFYFFSKAMGSPAYTKIEGAYSDISEMNVHKDTKNSIIEIQIGKRHTTFKFSPFEERSLQNVYAKWLNLSISPFIALLAALMYLASEDDDVSVEENDYILKLANNDEDLLNTAHNFYQEQPIETLFTVLKVCDKDQQYCIMANLLELAMCDGVLHSKELKLIRRFGRSMGMRDEEYRTIKQVMVMKNQLGILKRE